MVPGMSPPSTWHRDCSVIGGARDTGDDNITSCSRFSVTVVRTVTGHKAMRSSHAASPIFLPTEPCSPHPRHLDMPLVAPVCSSIPHLEDSMLDQYRRDYAEFNAAV